MCCHRSIVKVSAHRRTGAFAREQRLVGAFSDIFGGLGSRQKKPTTGATSSYFDTKYYCVKRVGEDEHRDAVALFLSVVCIIERIVPRVFFFGGGGKGGIQMPTPKHCFRRIKRSHTHLVHQPRTTPGAHAALRVRSKPRKSSCGTDCERRLSTSDRSRNLGVMGSFNLDQERREYPATTVPPAGRVQKGGPSMSGS